MELIFFLFVFILLDIAALRWASDSRDDINSREWELRRLWYGFH